MRFLKPLQKSKLHIHRLLDDHIPLTILRNFLNTASIKVVSLF
jgi:hypothetical protein